ncbi:MAG: hypothetical protein KF897_10015 [Opitutaceae bacterium]|nr:hypothetical protein [Opitutaceae bacterium]
MKSIVIIGTALLAAMVMAGCDATSGTTARIQEKSAVFATLTPEQKKNIEEGAIEHGYTTDMVYMALGKPSKTREQTAPEGTVVMWTYNNYYPTVTASAVTLNNPSRRRLNYQLSSTFANNQSTGPSAPSLSSTKPAGPEAGIDNLPDIPAETLYVLFLDGKVFQIKLEGE